MTNKMKFMLSEGMMLLSFSYGADGHLLPAIIASLIGVGIATHTNAKECLYKHYVAILSICVLQLSVAHFSILFEEVPVIGFLIVCNTIFSFLWMDADFEVIDDMMKLIVAVMLMIYCIAFITPVARFPFVDLFLYISFIFIPITILYVIKCFRDVYKDTNDFENTTNCDKITL